MNGNAVKKLFILLLMLFLCSPSEEEQNVRKERHIQTERTTVTEAPVYLQYQEYILNTQNAGFNITMNSSQQKVQIKLDSPNFKEDVNLKFSLTLVYPDLRYDCPPNCWVTAATEEGTWLHNFTCQSERHKIFSEDTILLSWNCPDVTTFFRAEIFTEGSTCLEEFHSCAIQDPCNSVPFFTIFDLQQGTRDKSLKSHSYIAWFRERSLRNSVRCVPNSLTCDGFPSCAATVNYPFTDNGENKESSDEFPGVCKRCQGLDWGFLITRAVVGIVFVLLPTLIIFLIFYRRQVALHRERLLRDIERTRRRDEAIASENFGYTEDLPPTYDDVYETKEPPPCFCQATSGNNAPEATCTCANTNKSTQIS